MKSCILHFCEKMTLNGTEIPEFSWTFVLFPKMFLKCSGTLCRRKNFTYVSSSTWRKNFYVCFFFYMEKELLRMFLLLHPIFWEKEEAETRKNRTAWIIKSINQLTVDLDPNPLQSESLWDLSFTNPVHCSVTPTHYLHGNKCRGETPECV